MVDFQFLGYTVIGAAILAAIALIGSHFSTIVSIISRHWRASIERARQQKAQRERLYGWSYVEHEAVLEQHGTGFDGGFGQNENAVLGEQNQENRNQFANIQDFLSSHNLTDEQAITILALMRRPNGDVFLSANKIRDTVGGADKDVKDHVAALRPKPPQPRLPLKRPANGW